MVSARQVPGMLFGLTALALAGASITFAETTPIGVITRVDGTATLARATLPPDTRLKFRDAVFAADRITTGDQSLARILFGGKALVTVRERSVLTITEAGQVSTVHVGVGQMAIAVVKDRVRPGETIDIRTPNAVATIRGTVVLTEVSPETPGADGSGDAFTTTITVLKGVVELKQLDTVTRLPIGPAVWLRAVERIQVRTGQTPLPSPQRLSRQAAQAIVNDLRVNVAESPAVDVHATRSLTKTFAFSTPTSNVAAGPSGSPSASVGAAASSTPISVVASGPSDSAPVSVLASSSKVSRPSGARPAAATLNLQRWKSGHK